MKFYRMLYSITFNGTVFNEAQVIVSPDEMPETICLGLVERQLAEEVLIVN